MRCVSVSRCMRTESKFGGSRRNVFLPAMTFWNGESTPTARLRLFLRKKKTGPPIRNRSSVYAGSGLLELVRGLAKSRSRKGKEVRRRDPRELRFWSYENPACRGPCRCSQTGDGTQLDHAWAMRLDVVRSRTSWPHVIHIDGSSVACGPAEPRLCSASHTGRGAGRRARPPAIPNWPPGPSPGRALRA